MGLLQNKKFRENHAEFFALQVVMGISQQPHFESGFESTPKHAKHALGAHCALGALYGKLVEMRGGSTGVFI